MRCCILGGHANTLITEGVIMDLPGRLMVLTLGT